MTSYFKTNTIRTRVIPALAVLGALAGLIVSQSARAAACPVQTVDYGKVTTVASVPATATYRIWSRMMPLDATNNSYMLEIDGTQCYTVSSNTGAGSWVWVDYQGGSAASKIQLNLAQGNHTFKLIGTKPGVKVDRVLMVSDLSCVPTGFGDDCNVPSDTTPPTVSLTAPAEGSTVSGMNVPVSAAAGDNTGVTKVDFYVNSQLLVSDTTSPYGVQWNSTTVSNGQQLVIAKAFDAAGNSSTASYYVTVQNGDMQAPTAPGNLTAQAAAYNQVALAWSASTDNTGVTGYRVYRNNSLLAQLGTLISYQDNSVLASTTYAYTVTALDAAGNESPTSISASATTPSVPDAQAPTVPSALVATVVSSRQINLSWKASTDNVGVAAYDIYRAIGTATPKKFTSVTTTSFGDTNLKANTQYKYYVTARDPAGNNSTASNTVTAKTLANKRTSRIVGTVSGSIIANAQVSVSIGGVKYTTTTNERGKYVIKGVPAGRYNVSYNAPGHYSRTLSVTVGDRTIVQNIKLQKK